MLFLTYVYSAPNLINPCPQPVPGKAPCACQVQEIKQSWNKSSLLSVFPGFFSYFFKDLLQRLYRKGGENDLIASAGPDL